jgi:hypothetical protein
MKALRRIAIATSFSLFFLVSAHAQRVGRCSDQKRSFKCTFYEMTADSAVYKNTPDTWGFGAEVLMQPPVTGTIVSVSELHFKLPPHGTVMKVQGTFGAIAPFGNNYTLADCSQPNAALAAIRIDGRTVVALALHFDAINNLSGKDRDLFFSYDIPIAYTEGDGVIEIQANPLGCWSDEELEGLMQVEFPKP